MANQRHPSKRLVSGYLDTNLKTAIKRFGEETQFVELAVIHELLTRKAISRSKLSALAEKSRLHPLTITTLTREKLL